MDHNYLIGKDNQLPWKIPAEMKYFSQTTANNTVLMGAKTFESIGKPLKNRFNVVITKNKEKYQNWQEKNLIFADDLKGILEPYKDNPNQHIFVIGGQEIYQQTFSIADYYYISIVKGIYEGNICFPFEIILEPDMSYKIKKRKGIFNEGLIIKKEEFTDFTAYVCKKI